MTEANPEEFVRRMQAAFDQINRERADNEARRAAFLASIATQTPEQRMERIRATGLIADSADLDAWMSQPPFEIDMNALFDAAAETD